MITKSECCEKTLEILLKNVKTLEDLDMIESLIESYQDIFRIELIKYMREVGQMRNEYLMREVR